jgi:hypothetical protein
MQNMYIAYMRGKKNQINRKPCRKEYDKGKRRVNKLPNRYLKS